MVSRALIKPLPGLFHEPMNLGCDVFRQISAGGMPGNCTAQKKPLFHVQKLLHPQAWELQKKASKAGNWRPVGTWRTGLVNLDGAPTNQQTDLRKTHQETGIPMDQQIVSYDR